MDLANELDSFIKNNGDVVFIEVEGKASKLESFFDEYNSHHFPAINKKSEGVITLKENVNKWGVELRLYMHSQPSFIHATYNATYRSDYSYRINDNNLIMEMFNIGYQIGIN